MSYLSEIIQLDQTQFTQILSGITISQNGNTIDSYDSKALYIYDKFVPEWSLGADRAIRADTANRAKLAVKSGKICSTEFNWYGDSWVDEYGNTYIPFLWHSGCCNNLGDKVFSIRYNSNFYYNFEDDTLYGPIFDIKRLWVSDDIIFKSTIDIKYQKDSNRYGRILMGDNDGIDISSTSNKKINIHTTTNEIDLSGSGFSIKANNNNLIKLSTSGAENYIKGNSNLIINSGTNYINFNTSDAGINYQSATWTERFKSLIINSDKSIQMTGKGGNCYFYAGTDGDPYKLEVGSYGVSYIKFDKTGIADFYGEVRFRGNVTFKGTATHEGDVLPSTDNSKNLGSSSYHWKALFIGSNDSYGSTTQPIYWDNGVPKATTYTLSSTINGGTANRMAYYSGANALSAATSIYATGDSLAINGIGITSGYNFEVNGSSVLRLIVPQLPDTYDIGLVNRRWKSIYNIDEYIGTASGSQCHLNFDDTNKCLRFTFD